MSNTMRAYKEIYHEIHSINNLFLAFNNAKKGKTKRRYVKRFKKNLGDNLNKLRSELLTQSYTPNKLRIFVLRDPKTRKISKSAFRDRVINHALCNIIAPILEKSFVYDSHANQVGKGTLKAIERFDYFKRKVSKNNTGECYVLKADVKHYFDEINHEILIGVIRRKINDKRTIWLIRQILDVNVGGTNGKGMPLGNLTSQFFANVYLNELDQYIKHSLKAKYYIRYVDDFVILHNDKRLLEKWKMNIQEFLKEKLLLELHPSKTHILRLNSGINFLGFRIFYHYKLLRKSNIKNFERRINHYKILFNEGMINREKIIESLEGWLNYANHANTYKYQKHVIRYFNNAFPLRGERINNKKKYWNFINKVRVSELQFSVQKILYYHNKGLRAHEIALIQGIKESTVWSHYSNLIEHKQISVWELLPRDKIIKILNKVYSRKDKLKDIKGRVNDSRITYDEIACVMASVKSKRKKKNKSPVTCG